MIFNIIIKAICKLKICFQHAAAKAVSKLNYHQKAMAKLFNQDQIRALSRRSTRGLAWQTDTIKKALKLRFSCGDTGYRSLLATGVPLPAVRTLQQKLQHIEFKPGVLSTVFKYLEAKVNLVNVIVIKLLMIEQYSVLQVTVSFFRKKTRRNIFFGYRELNCL